LDLGYTESCRWRAA